MISLFLNTASSYLNIALIKDRVVIDSLYEEYNRDLSKMALFRIKELLTKNGFLPLDVDKIYVVRGPGSFTGLRVGVTIAKIFAWGIDKDIYSLSNLYVMATSIRESDYIIPIIDARRGYVYAGIYDKNYDVFMSDRYIKLDELLDKVSKLDKKISFVSYDKFNNIENDFICYKPDLNNLFSNLKCRKEDYYSLVPDYLKRTEAEENLNK